MLSKSQKKAYRLILESLKNEPEKWTFTNYQAMNSEMCVWTGNRHYGTHFSYGSVYAGGVKIFWFLHEWWRVKLVNAVDEASIAKYQKESVKYD